MITSEYCIMMDYIRNANVVLDIFKQLTAENNLSLLVVTHDEDFAKRTDRIIQKAMGG
jgi:lipoprotein-releasing system ATP-binding protein